MIRDKLAERLKHFRERSALTIYEVGERIGKSGKTISAWENGRGQPDADMLLNLCEVYGIGNIGELYGEQPPKSLNGFSPKIELLLEKYNCLNDDGQEYIVSQLDFALSQSKYLLANAHVPNFEQIAKEALAANKAMDVSTVLKK